jgi:hypothetical protein
VSPVQRITTAIAAMPDRVNSWLATLPSTNFQVVTSALLALSTALVYYVAVLQSIEIDSMNFGMWLGFVAAYGGISYRQFKTKRETQHAAAGGAT